jgi:NADH-quinone oxidoreductase subunit G
VGSNIFTQTHKSKVKRVVARDNENINETWISDRDRFSYQGVNNENRVLIPKIKIEGEWQDTSWDDALDFATNGIKKHAKEGSQFGTLASKNATLEELYLLQKFTRGLGSDNLDYRLDASNPYNAKVLESNISLTELETIDHVLIVNSYLRLEQPMINHRIRKATLNGASVSTINAKAFDFNYRISHSVLTSPQNTVATLSGVLKALLDKNSQTLPDYLNSVSVHQTHIDIANALLNAEHPVVVLGEHVNGNKCSDQVATLVSEIAKASEAKTLNASLTGNAHSAERVNFKPENGKNALQILSSDLTAFVLFDVYPTFDCIDSENAIEHLSHDDAFVVAMNSFDDESVLNCANVILPIASFYETSGTHINVDNIAQSYSASVKSAGESKPGWKVIKVLADLLNLQGFDFTDSSKIVDEALSLTPSISEIEVPISNSKMPNITTVWQYTPYVGDVVVRHASSLQQTRIGQISEASVCKATAKLLELSEGDLYKGVPVNINESVAEGCVFVHTHLPRQC